MPMQRRVTRPVILGIVGDSAAGKSTLADGIASILGPERVAIICTDDYHRHSRVDRAKTGLSALDPQANYIDIMTQHLRLLNAGEPILKPIYNHHGGTLDAPVYVEPKEYVIVEGLLGYHTREMRDCYDVKLYLDPAEELRVNWKIQRDTGKRGYTREEVLEQLRQREYDTKTHIRPQRTFADIVVNFFPPQNVPEETGANLNVRHLLRPTLPHPDLSPILDLDSRNGFRLELARDTDGKPVDVLEIAGDLDDKRAKAIENLLWGLIPEAQHLRQNLGVFLDKGNKKMMSHPLALSQLFITYHMIKAAMGVHAV
ncbi:MAG: phosphoribulokinase [Deltaproteobacteria bacterium]|nr:phosphoribulokinase [Deltaproteobacteria bacterium]